MINGVFSEITEVSQKRFADSPLGRMSKNKTFDKPLSDYDKPLGLDAFKKDDTGVIYTNETGDLLANKEYELNGNLYKTDEKGRIESCQWTPQNTPENPRDIHAQISSGGEYRKAGDQGGHIVGRDMGGDGGLGNIVPMDSRINQSDYKHMENSIKKSSEQGKEVTAKGYFSYHGESKRPDMITCSVTIDGKDTVYTFDNNRDGILMNSLKEDLDKSQLGHLQGRLDEKGGEITSTKKEYDRIEVRGSYTSEGGKTLPLISVYDVDENNRGV